MITAKFVMFILFSLQPPVANIVPYEITTHGHTRIDNYYWLRDIENPAVKDYLEAENTYSDFMMSEYTPLIDTLIMEMRERITEDDASVPCFRNGYWYWHEYSEGDEYSVNMRRTIGCDNEVCVYREDNPTFWPWVWNSCVTFHSLKLLQESIIAKLIFDLYISKSQNTLCKEQMLKNISVIIPAYNEEQSIVATVETVMKTLVSRESECEIIVVDDGSSDATFDLASRTIAKVIRHSCNRGYGASLKTGIRAASNEVIAICDADGTYPVEWIPDLASQLDNCDMAVGSRTGQTVFIPRNRKLAKWFLRKLAAYITGRDIPDLNSGLRVFRKSLALQYFNLLPSGFSFTTTITVASLCDDLEVIYLPINYHQREGKSKINSSHFPNFIMLVLRLAVLFRPLKVFVPVSLFCLTMGLLKLTLDIVSAANQAGGLGAILTSFPVVSTTSVILFVSALQILLFGMVAEAMARRAKTLPGMYTGTD